MKADDLWCFSLHQCIHRAILSSWNENIELFQSMSTCFRMFHNFTPFETTWKVFGKSDKLVSQNSKKVCLYAKIGQYKVLKYKQMKEYENRITFQYKNY